MWTDLPFYFAVWTFWLAVIGFDLLALYSLRRSRIDATARVLWVAWVIGIPVVGALTYFIVRPSVEFGPRSPTARG